MRGLSHFLLAKIGIVPGIKENMPEIFVDTKGEFGLDAWSELVGRFPEHANRAIASAVKSEGSRLQKILKIYIQLGGVGVYWPALHPHTLAILAARRRRARWAAQAARGKKVRGSTVVKYRGHTEIQPGGVKPLRKLAGATRYYYDDTVKTVTVGFLNQKMRGLGKMHAAGYTKTVDRRMGKLLAALGFPVRTGTTLKTPARPVVGPVFEREKANIIKNVKTKTINNIYRYLTGGQKDWDQQDFYRAEMFPS